MSSKENVIVIYIRKDHINISIIKRMGEARILIPKYGFKMLEEDVSHDYAKQKELHQTPNAANEYPLFQFHKDKENIYHIGNIEALKAFLSSPPSSVLSIEDNYEGVQEEDINIILGDNEKPVSKTENEVKEEADEKKEEEEKEPALGFISHSLQTVEGVVKYSTSWFTSWFYTPPTVTPLPSDVNNSALSDNNNADVEVKKEDENKQVDEKELGEELKDFKVVQTNWYWRQQNRVLRFDLKNKTMYRYDPLDLSIRAIHPFTLLKDITCYNSQYFFQLTFAKADNDPSLVYEYYTSSSVDYPLILDLLTAHSSVAPIINP